MIVLHSLDVNRYILYVCLYLCSSVNNQIRHGRRKSGTKYSILLMFSPLTISPIQYSWDSQRRLRSSALRKSFHVNICISRLCIKMSSFLYMCTHAQCRVNFIHHVEFYFRFQHLITLPVYSQLWHSSQGE